MWSLRKDVSYQNSLSTCSGCDRWRRSWPWEELFADLPSLFFIDFFLFERESEWCYLQPCKGRLADLRDKDIDIINSVMLLLQAQKDESTTLMAQHNMLASACKEHGGNKNIFTKVLRVMIWVGAGAFGHPVIYLLLFLLLSILCSSSSSNQQGCILSIIY